MRKVFPITPSTGGIVAIKDVVGREEEINLFWGVLQKQGIALFAERRFGKSSILRKMEADGQEGFIPIYKPIEGESSPEGLVSELINRVREKDLIDEGALKTLENLYNKATQVVGEVKGIKLKKLEYTWQEQLYYLLDKLIEKHKDKKIVLILDEFSIFLDNSSNEAASTIIGFLRDIVHENKFRNIRFIYCGSIGIDLVLDKIKKDGHNIGDPLNHMYKHSLQPFTDDNAMFFGKCLNLGCKLNLTLEQIKQICIKSDNIPFFIDKVFSKLPMSYKEKMLEKIDNAFEEILDDTTGKESIRHFYDRIEHFYPNKMISIYILNFISKSTAFVTETEIANNVMSNTTGTNRVEINNEIDRLMKDGYLYRLVNDEERTYDFKYSLLKSWWKRNKAF